LKVSQVDVACTKLWRFVEQQIIGDTSTFS
jgi:hypothetical protein